MELTKDKALHMLGFKTGYGESLRPMGRQNNQQSG